MEPENKSLLMDEIATDVSLLSFLTAISVFFIGSLLPKFSSYDLSVKIPISFLIISTFAFLFSALILSNASQKVVKGDYKKMEKFLTYGYVLSEYMGVYLFVLSVPLTMSVITEDPYLRTVTFIAAISGISLYQFMGFSLLEDHFSKTHKRLSFLVVALGTGLFLAQIYAFHFTVVAVIFLIAMLFIAFLAPHKRFQ